MFTGIISDVGTVALLKADGDIRARIETSYDIARLDLGASVACDGVCLTVVEKGLHSAQNWFEVEISSETVSKTKISNPACGWKPGARINLERALRLGDELGGHIVSGHVDGVAEILDITKDGDSTRVQLRAPDYLSGFIASKGSVALNGTSLTVNDVEGCVFGVNLIPHTKLSTTWGSVSTSDIVNLEIDTLARYVARLRSVQGG